MMLKSIGEVVFFLVNIYGKGSNFKQPNLSLICNEGIVGFEFTTP
jgi:hypothetical protein